MPAAPEYLWRGQKWLCIPKVSMLSYPLRSSISSTLGDLQKEGKGSLGCAAIPILVGAECKEAIFCGADESLAVSLDVSNAFGAIGWARFSDTMQQMRTDKEIQEILWGITPSAS